MLLSGPSHRFPSKHLWDSARHFTLAVLLSTSLTPSPSRAQSDDIQSILTKKNELAAQKNSLIELDQKASKFVASHSAIIERYAINAERFNNSVDEFKSHIENSKQAYDQIAQWLRKSILDLNDSPTFPTITKVRDEYQANSNLREFCTLSAYHSISEQLVQDFKEMHADEERLTLLISASALPNTMSALVEAAQSNLILMKNNSTSAQAFFESIADGYKAPQFCNLFANFGSIISIAVSIDQINKDVSNLEKVSLKSFIEKIDSKEKSARFLRDQRRFIAGLEGMVLTKLRENRLRDSIEAIASIGSVFKMISDRATGTDYLTPLDKLELLSRISDAVTRIEDEQTSYGLDTLEGRRTILVSRARRVQKILRDGNVQISSQTEDRKKLFEGALDFAERSLSIKPTGLIRLPKTESLTETLLLDDKLEYLETVLINLGTQI